jgi:hypothetical protein
MGLPSFEDDETRFSAYIAGLTSVIWHADRAKPLRDYCVGLMMPCERKSVEPMAAITALNGPLRSISHCCTLLARESGLTRKCWPRYGNRCCLRWSDSMPQPKSMRKNIAIGTISTTVCKNTSCASHGPCKTGESAG